MRRLLRTYRAGRQCSHGQRLLAEGSYQDAIETFERGLEADPDFPHLYLYRGLAQAELSRYDDALASLALGARLSPRSHVFPLYMGQVNLDAGRVAAAASSLEAAAPLDPANFVVNGYRRLVDCVRGDTTGLSELAQRISWLPDGLKARVLTFLPELFNQHHQIDEGRQAAANSRWPLLDRIRVGRLALLRFRAERQIARRRYRNAIRLFERYGDQLPTELADLSRRADSGAVDLIDSQLRALGSRDQRGLRRKSQATTARTERSRRMLLLEREALRRGDASLRSQDLREWLRSFRRDASPERERSTASDVLLALAELSLESKDVAGALKWYEQSRQLGGAADLEWTEARIRLNMGETVAARRLFERYGHRSSLAFGRRVSDLLESSISRPARPRPEEPAGPLSQRP